MGLFWVYGVVEVVCILCNDGEEGLELYLVSGHDYYVIGAGGGSDACSANVEAYRRLNQFADSFVEVCDVIICATQSALPCALLDLKFLGVVCHIKFHGKLRH